MYDIYGTYVSAGLAKLMIIFNSVISQVDLHQYKKKLKVNLTFG